MSSYPSCGAWRLPLANSCSLCGAESQSVPIGDPVARTLRRLGAGPAFAQAKSAGARRPAPLTHRECPPLAFFALLAGATLWLLPLARLPIFACLCLALLWQRQKQRHYQSRSLQGLAAYVLSADPWEGPGRRQQGLARLQFSNGQRRGLRLPSSIPLQLKPGDYGAAFVRGDLLLDFRSLPPAP